MEKIKRDANRVDIAKLTATDISGDDLTGGYIFKIDKQTGGGGSGWNSSFPSTTGSNIFFQYAYPKEDDIVIQQKDYIAAYVDTFETVLSSPGFADPVNGYRKYAEAGSFIDYFILNEISKNVDGYRLSTFLYKDKQSKGGKINIGPAWDYNLGWWNADYCEGSLETGWAYKFGTVCGGDFWQVPVWWERLLLDNTFRSELKCRWNELRASTLSNATLNNYVDSVGAYLNEAQGRHFTAWPIIGVYTWPNPSPLPTSYAGEITALKSWIQNRMVWLDANMPGTCTVSINETIAAAENLDVFPNPFENEISLSFYLKSEDHVKIEITDVYGKLIKQVAQTSYPQGAQSIRIQFDNGLSSGVYFVKVATANGSMIKKLVRN
jgi:hypothetical protein